MAVPKGALYPPPCTVPRTLEAETISFKGDVELLGIFWNISCSVEQNCALGCRFLRFQPTFVWSGRMNPGCPAGAPRPGCDVLPLWDSRPRSWD